jgi:hypothetical protein
LRVHCPEKDNIRPQLAHKIRNTDTRPGSARLRSRSELC